jgi:hypothetical protein
VIGVSSLFPGLPDYDEEYLGLNLCGINYRLIYFDDLEVLEAGMTLST